ncbi:GTP-binding protein [Sedimenticola thiotaurini]|uniref:GTP-binding protein n=1 Tax=Sedimenticola thiotaurini TaxID=1543721 RepID=UPI002FF524D1
MEDNERPVVVHGVQHIFHPPVTLPAWPSEDQRSRLVFITDGVDRDVIENTFREFR